MTDVVSPETRSRMMSGIRDKNTRAELVVRKGLFARGFRYRLHDTRLPGKPDLVFPRYRAVIFVHGCFWHGHNCHLFKWPATRPEFWRQKIGRNREKDAEVKAALAKLGWRVLVIWECALKGKQRWPLESLIDEIISWLRTGKLVCEIKGGTCNSPR